MPRMPLLTKMPVYVKQRHKRYVRVLGVSLKRVVKRVVKSLRALHASFAS